MECGCCIFDRLRNEGMWDRFGTTWQQELEAMCIRHLDESEKLYRGHGVPEWEAWANDFAEEQKRREALFLIELST